MYLGWGQVPFGGGTLPPTQQWEHWCWAWEANPTPSTTFPHRKKCIVGTLVLGVGTQPHPQHHVPTLQKLYCGNIGVGRGSFEVPNTKPNTTFPHRKKWSVGTLVLATPLGLL